MAGLKGLEAAFVLAIAQQRYSLRSEATVSTDLAALYVTSAFTTRLNGHMGHDSAMKDLVTDTDIHDSYKHPWRQLCTNIYRTRTGRYYHTHGSLDALASMGVLGLDHARVDENKDRASILNKYQEAVGQWDPDELDIAVNEGAKQAGVPCYSWDGRCFACRADVRVHRPGTRQGDNQLPSVRAVLCCQGGPSRLARGEQFKRSAQWSQSP